MKLRAAIENDRYWIPDAYLEMLNYLDGQDYQIIPSEENAEWMMSHVFFPAIMEHRGVYVGYDEDTFKPVGALFWIEDSPLLEVRYPVATSYGQWVSEDYRGKGIVADMVDQAAEHLRDSGIERIIDMVHTEESRKAALSCGFKISENVVTLTI